MFEPFLFCRVFGLTGTGHGTEVELARWWSGQPELKPIEDGSIHWDKSTSIKINESLWYGAPPRLDLRSRAPVRWLRPAEPIVAPLCGRTCRFCIAVAIITYFAMLPASVARR